MKFVKRFYGSFAHAETSFSRFEFEPYSPDNARYSGVALIKAVERAFLLRKSDVNSLGVGE